MNIEESVLCAVREGQGEVLDRRLESREPLLEDPHPVRDLLVCGLRRARHGLSSQSSPPEPRSRAAEECMCFDQWCFDVSAARTSSSAALTCVRVADGVRVSLSSSAALTGPSATQT